MTVSTELPDWSVDPANAKNWATAKKIYNTAIPSLLCLLMLVHSSILWLPHLTTE